MKVIPFLEGVQNIQEMKRLNSIFYATRKIARSEFSEEKSSEKRTSRAQKKRRSICRVGGGWVVGGGGGGGGGGGVCGGGGGGGVWGVNAGDYSDAEDQKRGRSFRPGVRVSRQQRKRRGGEGTFYQGNDRGANYSVKKKKKKKGGRSCHLVEDEIKEGSHIT